MHSPFVSASFRLTKILWVLPCLVALSLLGATCPFSLRANVAGPMVSGATTRHPFHISIMEADWNPKTKHLELSIRVFTQDLEEALCKVNRRPVELSTKHQLEPELQTYLERNLKLFADGKPLILQYHGKELANDVTWLYVETTEAVGGKLEVRNTLLFDLFDDQNNLMNLKAGGAVKSFLFQPATPKHTITL